MIIETERLILRPWREEDAPAMYKYASDPRIGPSAGWPVHESEQDSLEVIRRLQSQREVYAVVPKDVGEPVGSAGLSMNRRYRMGRRSAELGFWTGAPYWGRGYAAEAAMALIERGFTELALREIWCASYQGNLRSERVQEKCGFIRQGTVRDVRGVLPGTSHDENFSRLTVRQWKRKEKRGTQT